MVMHEYACVNKLTHAKFNTAVYKLCSQYHTISSKLKSQTERLLNYKQLPVTVGKKQK